MLTAFIIEIWKNLQEDNAATTAILLRRISLQMANISDNSVPLPPQPSEFESSSIAKVVNIFWFSSLMLGVFAALFGIFVKQWLHTYNSWTDIDNPREAVMLCSVYHNGLFAWHVSEILSVLPLLLQSGLLLFLAGLITYLWTLDTAVAICASVFAFFGTAAVLWVILLPMWYKDCAYKSPLAFFLIWRWQGAQASKWQTLDLERAKQAYPDPEENPVQFASCELEHLLGIIPADQNGSLANSTLVVTRINELESYAEKAPFGLVQAAIEQVSKMPPLEAASTPYELLGTVTVLSCLTQSKRYHMKPQVIAGIIAHVYHWNPQFEPHDASAEKCVEAVALLHQILLHHFGKDGLVKLHEAGAEMLVKTLDQWIALAHSDSHVASYQNSLFPDVTQIPVDLHKQLYPPAAPTVLSHSSAVSSVACSSNGAYIAAGLTSGQVVLWDAHTHEIAKTMDGYIGYVCSVAFSPDCKYIASGSNDPSVHIWDVDSGTTKCVFEGYSDWVRSVAFSVDGSKVASGSDDCTKNLGSGRWC